MNKPEKQLRKLKITDDEVIINFVELSNDEQPTNPDDPNGELDLSESETASLINEFQVKGKFKPHKDLTDSMKKLRKFALEICEIEVDSKDLPNWNVSALKIDGDLLMKQSRVTLTLTKKVKRTEKLISFNTPQTTMYGESEYHNAEKMAPVIEDVVEEAWSYLDGTKREQEGQLPLFTRGETIELNFTK